MAFRSRHGDFSSKILTPPVLLNDRVIALERRGEWIRVQSIVGRDATNSEERNGYHCFTRSRDTFVPADDVYVIFTHLDYSLVLLAHFTFTILPHRYNSMGNDNKRRFDDTQN